VLNRLFGVTLWCKTLVLRKDKVTQCIDMGDGLSSRLSTIGVIHSFGQYPDNAISHYAIHSSHSIT